MTMDKKSLHAWADQHADGPVTTKPDYRLSISSKLLRFRWNDAPTVAVGSDTDGKTRINAVLDAIALLQRQPEPAGSTVHLLLGTGTDGAADPSLREHLGAIGTLVTELHRTPDIQVWALAPGGPPTQVAVAPAAFTTGKPADWAKMLMTAAETPVRGMAADVVKAMHSRPSFALYPKLSSLQSAEPWQMRLDGLEIGRTGPQGTTLRLNSGDLTRPARATSRLAAGRRARTHRVFARTHRGPCGSCGPVDRGVDRSWEGRCGARPWSG